MTVFVDDRIGAKELVPYIHSHCAITRLEYADISFRGNGPHGPVSIGIERKRFRDLMDSISSGRLSGHQLIGLMNSYDYVYLLVEGLFKIGKDGYLRRPKGRSWVVVQLGNRSLTSKYMYNYLNELAIVTHIASVFTASPRLSALWIDGVYSWWTKQWDEHQALMQFFVDKPPPRAFFSTPKLLVRMVKEIEGVGWKKAKALGRKYATIKSLLNFDLIEEYLISHGINPTLLKEARCYATSNGIQKLIEVPGIGKKLANDILKSLGDK